MIRSIFIENFKGIKQGKIEDLADVNILIGKNNSGKSTILETLFFIKAAIEPNDILHNPVLQYLLQRRVFRRMTRSEEFFYKYEPNNKISIKLFFKKGNEIALESNLISNNIKYEIIIPNAEFNPIINVSPTSNDANISDFSFQGRRSAATSHRNPLEYIMAEFNKVGKEDEQRKYFIENENEFNYIKQITLIDIDIIRKLEEIELVFWEKIRRDRTDKEVVYFLNTIYDTKIEDIALIPYATEGLIRERGERRTFHKLTMAVQDISLNLDGYGEGFRDAFSILLLAGQLNNTALLIEEPEAHQHPESLKRLFKYLLTFIKKNKLQLFITTHSLDIISALSDFSHECEINIYHIDLDSEGILSTRMIKGVDAKLLANIGLDLRFLSRLFSYLIIEGKTDRKFINSLANKLQGKSIEEFPYEIFERTKTEQKEFLKAIVTTGKPIKVVRDYDDKQDIETIVKDYESSLKNIYDVERKDNQLFIKDTNSIVTIIATGLPKDPDLETIGINNYAIEDYLLKLLKIDKNVKKWAKITLKGLRKRADKLRYLGSLNKSKTLLLALGVIKDISEDNLIKIIIEESNIENLCGLLKPLIDEIFGT